MIPSWSLPEKIATRYPGVKVWGLTAVSFAAKIRKYILNELLNVLKEADARL
jgi:hypothetical protein